jgi:WD40 repeat protein/mono/diheme cytochrome c family protein
MRPSLLAPFIFAAASTAALAAEKPVSFSAEVAPIFKAQCNGCHRAGKSKGELVTTNFAALLKGGKKGHDVVPGDTAKSLLVKMISGPEPDMPEDGDPLKPEQVALIARWVAEGAKDDTPTVAVKPLEPPIYTVAPVITSFAWAPDGQSFAVNGYHEVLIHKADGSEVLGRLVGEATRIESIAYSPDGKYIGVCGGSPAEFGQIQVWDAATRQLYKSYKISTDSLYGLSWAPDGKSVAVGAADKTAYRVAIEDGKLLMEFKAHSDWVLATAFTPDGKQMVTGGRDKALKLIDTADGRFVDDINNPVDVIVGFARHPKEMQVAYGGESGTPRLYKISDNQGRTAGRNDSNLLRAFEQQPGPASALAFSPDGSLLAVGSVGEVRVYKTADGARVQTLAGAQGPVYAVSFRPDGQVIATGGFDGKVRFYNAADGKPIKEFAPVPLTAPVASAAAVK